MSAAIPPQSPLANLKARRKAIADAQVKDLRVPRWSDPEIWVRYRPLTYQEMRGPQRAIGKSSGQARYDVEFASNVDLLVNAAVGVYAVLDGKEFSLDLDSPDGDLTRFDDRLAAALGLEASSARDVCRAIFFTEGDLLSQAKALAEWSGLVNRDVDEEFAGE